jgi:hypothetical protein
VLADANDIRYRQMLFYFHQDDHFPAIVRLLAARKQSQFQDHIDESELMLGSLFLSYGHHEEAARIFERLLANNVGPEIRDQAWLLLARLWHQRGYRTEAQQALDNIESELAAELESERQMLQTQLYIDNSEHGRALTLLQDWSKPDPWTSYAKFNIGVAMAGNGRVDAAADLLEELGQLETSSEEMRSLRDKANLALGYAYLQDGRPQAARMVLNRVRFEGPFSNKALLGIGWAETEIDGYERALVPWMELLDRDMYDPAVQESMLAVPYAMVRLNALNESARHYVTAVETYGEEIRRIDSTIEHIRSGRMTAALMLDGSNGTTSAGAVPEEFPAEAEWRYLYPLLAKQEFQQGLNELRELNFLLKNLDDWLSGMNVFRDTLSKREIAYEQKLPFLQEALSQASINNLNHRKLEFDARLNNIESSNDSLALATSRELELWGEVAAAERDPAFAAQIAESEDVRNKVKLLKGVLLWTLDNEFDARLASARQHVRETDQALAEAQRMRRQIDEAMHREKLLIADFKARIGNLGPKIDALKTRVATAISTQRTLVEGIAVEDLRAQRSRLDNYAIQARFALAAIYDIAASQDQRSMGDAAP